MRPDSETVRLTDGLTPRRALPVTTSSSETAFRIVRLSAGSLVPGLVPSGESMVAMEGLELLVFLPTVSLPLLPGAASGGEGGSELRRVPALS